MKRIGILGVGAIGGYFGAKLAGAYTNSDRYEIIFIQRGPHFKAIKAEGLRYITKKTVCVHPDLVVSSPEEAGMLDVVFVCLKSRDLDSAMHHLQAALHPHSVIIPTLNGLGMQERIQSLLPTARVLGGCIYVSAEIEKAGTVKQMSGAGYLYFGEKNGIVEYSWIEQLLTEAGIKAVLTINIELEIWKKYLFVGSMALMTSFYLISMGAVLQFHLEEWTELMHEIILIASTKHVSLSQSDIDACIERAAKIPYGTKTSMLIDIENGKKPEIDTFAGFVIETAKQNKLSLPLHQRIHAVLEKRVCQ